MTLVAVLQIAGIIVGLVLTCGGVGAMVWAVSKVRGVEASIGILTDANAALREVISDNALKEARDRESFRLQLHNQEKDCATKIAKLEGQVDVLTGGLADRILAAVNADVAATRLDSRLTAVENKIESNTGDGR